MTLKDPLKQTQYHWILGLQELKESRVPNLWDFVRVMQAMTSSVFASSSAHSTKDRLAHARGNSCDVL
jgi:hypothetical protein